MGGDRGDAKGLGGVPSPGGQAEHWDDGKMLGRQGFGIPPSGGGTGNRRNPTHKGVH